MNDETKIRSVKAKPSTSWVGYRVRLLRDLSTNHGHIFLGGTEMTVTKCYRGLSLADDKGRQINRVQKYEVTVVSQNIAVSKNAAGSENTVVSKGQKT